MFRIIQTLINIVFGIIEALLLIRFVFKFLSVNSGASFVAWIYNTTAQLVAPFVGIIPNWKIVGFVIDFPTFIAIIIYSLVGYFLMQIFPRDRPRY